MSGSTSTSSHDDGVPEQSAEQSAPQSAPQTQVEIEAHLEQTRRDLAETVDALGAKLDVKTRARQQAQATKERAAHQVDLARSRVGDATAQGRDALSDEAGDLKPVVPVAGGVAVLVVAALVVLAVRRRRR